MQSFGDYLKKEREARNISLREVAHSTKISEWYLKYLEKDAYDKIPAGPYITGYISSYANFIGIDADEVLKRYRLSHAERNKKEETQEDKNIKKGVFLSSKIKLYFLLSIALVGVLAFGFFKLFSRSQKDDLFPGKMQRAEEKVIENTPVPKTKEEAFPSKRTNLSLPWKEFDQPSDIQRKTEAKKPDESLSSEIGEGSGEHITGQMPIAEKPIPEHQDAGRIAATSSPPGAEELREEARRIHSSIEVLSVYVCADVRNKNPVGEGNSFQWPLDKIYTWNFLKLKNTPCSIRHIYYFKGQKVGDIELKVQSSPWRTWSCKTLPNEDVVGPWRVDVTSSEGEILRSISFKIKSNLEEKREFPSS